MKTKKANPVIMAVDDSPAVLKAVSSVLSATYRVFTLSKPADLERILNRIEPDLFLLDYKLPNINGHDLIPLIRGVEDHQETPIILLASAGSIDNVPAAAKLGACDVIGKPFIADVLREKVARHI